MPFPLLRDKYTRVSTILSPFSGLQNIPPDIVEHAAERGTKVHKICEGIIAGFGELGVDDETAPYVESFKEWWNRGHDVYAMEQRYYCDDLQLTGQIDLIVQTATGLCIIDFKTSYKPSKTWLPQAQAYYYLAKKNGLDVTSICFLHLQKTGKPAKMHVFDCTDELFMEIFHVYQYFFHKEIK